MADRTIEKENKGEEKSREIHYNQERYYGYGLKDRKRLYEKQNRGKYNVIEKQ